ncbi:MAG TPA: class I SAM-dependent methyltransferase [Solirubrobacteraceae bacterium]
MAKVQLNLSAEGIVRALESGELPWTLHPACDFASDPGQWGASLINNAEVMIACLEAAGVRSVVEVGAYAGDLTRFLLDWAQPSGARVWAIDPSPQPELDALATDRAELTLVRDTSLAALPGLERMDAYVIDGDHNYYTVTEEIRAILGDRPDSAEQTPLLLFHDVGWPHARRDDYYAPDQIPDQYRQPTVEGGGLFPGLSEPRPGGLPYKWPAAHEGGARNGVLTAIEDYVDAAPQLRLAIVPSFFGFGVVWHTEASYAPRLAELLAPLDRNPLIARVEANRAFHLASMHNQLMEVAAINDRVTRQEALLHQLSRSRAFRLVEVLSKLRQRVGIAPDVEAVSRARVRKAIEH